jgi:acetylornithine deacetylase/succinyl-diaminopimelate desuccinylase-like protein
MRHMAALALSAFVVGTVPDPLSPHAALAKDIFKQLIEINTTDSVGNVTKAAEAVAGRLRKAGFPPADVQVLGPDPRKGNLVARYHGGGTKRPLLLVAHLDVVEANREDWSFDPFVFLEKDGYFYGRGTADDKAMASIFTANLIRLKEEGFRPDRDLILALTADEEGGNFNGVEWLVKNHRDLIDAGLAINEGGSGQMRNGRYLVNEVQASEKVYQDFALATANPGGHSSRPVRDNAIYHLAAGLSRLAAFDFPVHMTEVSRAYFQRMADLQTDATVAADMRAIAASRPDPQAAARLAAASPYYNALMRTTCVATRLAGGHANNALPQAATANVNCRILPGELATTIRQALIDLLGDPSIAVSFVGEPKPSEPSSLTPEIMHAVESITDAIWPGLKVAPVMSTGATDSLYLRNAGIPTYGVEGIFYDIDDNRLHGRDERVGSTQYFDGLEFQYRLIKALASSRAAMP